MQQMHPSWSLSQIKQCEKESGQVMLMDERLLISYGQDFGHIVNSHPAVACCPQSVEKIQAVLSYANQQGLPVTLRGKGLSQGGQSLPVNGGLSLHLEQLNSVLDKETEAIWVEANTTWSELFEKSLKFSQLPYVFPYNCNLPIAGVLSVAGIGASSFKFGPISSHVTSLEVVLADGKSQIVDAQSPLFHACFSGLGRFAAITKVRLKLRPCLKKVRTFFLAYQDREQWFNDLVSLKKQADYLEAFCSPSLQGSRLFGDKRLPFAQWLFAIHLSLEYEDRPPELQSLHAIMPWKLLHIQDESIHSYLHRHDSRFEVMKLTGQWELFHPWYECFLPAQLLTSSLDELLMELPLHYATIIQVVPLANNQQTGFFMQPETREVYELMILNPGVNPAFLMSSLDVVKNLDARFLKQGGKRYLAGYLGHNLKEEYWQKHFGSLYQDWRSLKEQYDAKQILGSYLCPD